MPRVALPCVHDATHTLQQDAVQATPLMTTHEIGPAMHAVRRYLDNLAREFPHAKSRMAVVLDIDDTVLTSEAQPRVIAAARRVYQTAVAHGMQVWFVTARPDSPAARRDTQEQLASHGFPSFAGLVLMPCAHARHNNFSPFKADVRTQLQTKHGLHLVLAMGDAWHDLFWEPPHVPRHVQRNERAVQALRESLMRNFPSHKGYAIAAWPGSGTAWVSVKMPQR